MSAWLNSPAAMVIAVVIVLAWGLTLGAIFKPRKTRKNDENDPHICF